MQEETGGNSLLELCAAARKSIQIEAATSIAAGRAKETLVDDGKAPVLLLEPQNPLAAPLEITIISERLLDCSPGRHGMSIELFSSDEAELLGQIRDLVGSVLRGEYREIIRESERKSAIAAEWTGSRGTERALLNAFRSPRPKARGWRAVSYQPY